VASYVAKRVQPERGSGGSVLSDARAPHASERTVPELQSTIYISDSGDGKNDGLSLQTAIYSLERAEKLGGGMNDFSSQRRRLEIGLDKKVGVHTCV
jgi:hypothetical protein